MFTVLIAFAFALLPGAAAYLLFRRYQLLKFEMDDLQHKIQADFTDRRAIERELAHMASFSEVAPHPIIETDTSGRVFYVNPAALALFPRLAADGVNHPVLAGLEEVAQKVQGQEHALTTRPIKVGERIYEQQVERLTISTRLRLYMTDITELKRLDQLKTDFVNMVSHELRTPLSAINASLSMIQHGILGETTADQKQALSLALKSMARLNRMISELLDVSKIEAGKLEIERSHTDFQNLIQEITQSFEPLALERGLQLKSTFEGAPLEVEVDRDKISEVLYNLIQNAMKFTEKGEITIVAKRRDQDILCAVKDTGPGIPPEMLSKVFQKFQQIGNVARNHEKGTGLGLSLCKGLVELHGGRIWVESRLHEGTCFSFTLPLAA